jgi:hypothetical protein
MEEQWKRFTSIIRKHLFSSQSAVSPCPPESPSAPEEKPSPVSPAYIPVNKPDAIAELCLPTGSVQMDEVHIILIDLLQKDLIAAVCTDADPTLRYSATDKGQKLVEDHLRHTVDDMLGRIFDD